MNPSETLPAAWGRTSLVMKGCILALVGFTLLLCLHLWPAWTGDPDLSHGIFMPLAFVFLLWEARAGCRRYLSPGWSAGLILAFAISGLCLLSLAGLYASVLDWSHALVSFLLSGALALFLAAGIAAFSDEGVRLIPFNWSAAIAAALWVMSSPIPPGTYSRLTVLLQLWVSSGVVDTLNLLGVAAAQSGNVIHLASTSVGVEEACSGVRSLVSCIFCGIFFSGTLVRRPWPRALIVALAAPLALAMNFLRSLALTLLADRGVAIAGTWHDVTGFAILGVTAVILAALALWLGRSPGASTEGARPLPPDSRASEPARLHAARHLPLAFLLAAAAVLLLGFFANTRPSANRSRQPPDLWAALPESEPGWTVSTDRTLYRFTDTLKTDLLAQRIYERPTPSGPLQITLYLAYWRPGQAPVSLVASHTPDACWPGTGWVLEPPPGGPPAQPSIGGRPIAGAESRYFTNRGFPQYVWFWHLYDGRPIPYQDPYSFRRLLGIAWHYGFRHSGDQLFVRVSGNCPWSSLEEQPLVRDFFNRLRPLGL